MNMVHPNYSLNTGQQPTGADLGVSAGTEPPPERGSIFLHFLPCVPLGLLNGMNSLPGWDS
jgi:hypothetical protein